MSKYSNLQGLPAHWNIKFASLILDDFLIAILYIVQDNMTFGSCDLPEPGIAPSAEVKNETSFGVLNTIPREFQWLLGVTSVTILLSLWARTFQSQLGTFLL